MTSIDGVIAVALFLMFVAWSLVYFSYAFIGPMTMPLSETAGTISEKVVDYIASDFYEMPVSHYSANNTTDSVFYLDYAWPSAGAKNSTMVYKDGNQLSCNITSDRLYWQADADEGNSYFVVTYSDKEVAMNCTSGSLGSPVNKTIPWSAVKKQKVSQGLIDNMTSTSYDAFRELVGVNRDFRIELNVSGSMTEYGPPLPNATSVYVETVRHAMENDDRIEIRVLVW